LRLHGFARRRGFTLIEVLVVLVIMAAMAGLLVIGVRDSPEQRLRREADNLAALINAASDEAVLRSMEFGLAIDDEGYRFVYFDMEKKQWLAAPERALAEHAFPDTVTVSMALDGEELDEQTRERMRAFSEQGEDEKLRPLILLLSSGEITPFTLTLEYGEEFRVVLQGDGLNPVVVAQRG
jgi:general secretion pathway protein H